MKKDIRKTHKEKTDIVKTSRKNQWGNHGPDRDGDRIRFAIAIILLIFSGGIMLLSADRPVFSEWYSRAVYPLLVESLGRIWGIFPLSVSEMALYILLAAMVLSFLTAIIKTIRSHRGRKGGGSLISWFSGVLLIAGVLALLYTLCCGINYHRRSFSEEEGIHTEVYSAQQLEEVCRWLTEEVNERCGSVSRDEKGIMRLDAPEGEGAVAAMNGLAEDFHSLEGYYPQPKKVSVSEILSYQGLTGIYSPFTVEANYNGDMTAYNIPFTACHELSHLRGFMQEEEANFIGFLACISSERMDFQYSGYLSGWVYCMNALYRADYERWEAVRKTLDDSAEADLAANNDFWERYEGKISETADKINDTYLKVNGQADGVKSYGRMVDLIVACYGNIKNK